MPFKPWQFEQTCCASVWPETSGLARLRERVTLLQPPSASAASATQRINLRNSMFISPDSVGGPEVDEKRIVVRGVAPGAVVVAFRAVVFVVGCVLHADAQVLDRQPVRFRRPAADRGIADDVAADRSRIVQRGVGRAGLAEPR